VPHVAACAGPPPPCTPLPIPLQPTEAQDGARRPTPGLPSRELQAQLRFASPQARPRDLQLADAWGPWQRAWQQQGVGVWPGVGPGQGSQAGGPWQGPGGCRGEREVGEGLRLGLGPPGKSQVIGERAASHLQRPWEGGPGPAGTRVLCLSAGAYLSPACALAQVLLGRL